MKLRPTYATADRLKYIHICVVAALHLIALAAPFTFSWTGLLLCLILFYATGACGITLCYHRLLTHHSYKTFRPIRYFLTFLGTASLQGGPISWVATHRLHHQLSDEEDDPHSPTASFLWSHMLWIFYRLPGYERYKELRNYAKDLDKERCMRFFEKFDWPINVVFSAAIFCVGAAVGGWSLGISWLVWGVALRIVLVWHSTWLVNSASHVWGYRNYKTADNSRNLWWVALITFGEGWHNNHHADQRSASHGHRWYEFDVTYFTIRIMEWFGLAKEVVKPTRYGAIFNTLRGSSSLGA